MSKQCFLPPATIGIVGGGQLGQMMALAAKAMGYRILVLDPTPNAPAGQVADEQIVAAYDDTAALLRLAQASDVLTYEFENVDLTTLRQAQQYAALPQGTELLAISRDRIREKTFLADNGLPVTPFASVPTAAALPAAIARIGYPAILKTTTGGYDGHGQQDVNSAADLPAAAALAAKTPCILEKRQAYTRELSIMVTRDGNGTVRCFPVVENRHAHHILHTTIAPAPRLGVDKQAAIQAMAARVANGLHLAGVLGIELFETPAGILVNELAPRPHNSGHYSIEACNFSQFAAHILSICGLPIPPITLRKPAVMRNLLGTDLTTAMTLWPAHPEWHFHDYGKAEIRPGRKMGHITVVAEEKQSLANLLASVTWEDNTTND
ncbi:PurK [Schleiferilactobacillus shenzhenensis LY-73]|uniref:N5-carboxyaminoimidazole ribonucleotide synthase n=1 Tax=Schleiferilactobacillus shenzhenensis LY-73 TaxID=1231336 RepID=U4TSK7_9LACO|nr:5-(carboxyamino)imidazole ribonucleotide synthase [Schleiferilactobacillus shenzhenensis]ERL64848.1 PurK [Schleiferilactobacillus shenzhenensis LY-73]